MRVIFFSLVMGILASLSIGWSSSPVPVASAGGCSTVGTERQQNLSKGWVNIAQEDNLPMGTYTIGGKAYSTVVVTAMEPEEREALADQWVRDNDGTSELAAYWEELAECEGTTSRSSAPRYQNDERDAACRALAESWLSEWTSANISVDDVEVVTTCRRDADGEWFAPDGPSDERLTSPILTDEEIAVTTALRDTILSQVDTFEERLDAVVGDRSGRSMKAVIYAGYDSKLMATNDNMSWTHARPYGELLDAFLTDPTNTALDRYVTWLNDSHRAVAERRCVGINPYGCQALRNSVVPELWPWALRNEVTLSTHLKWALDNGYVDRPIETPSARDASSAECSTLAYWLGGTVSRVTAAEASTALFSIGRTPGDDHAPDLDQWADELDRLIPIQEASDPPTAGLALNALLVQWWSRQAESYRVLASAGRAGDQDAWDHGVALAEEALRYADEAKRVIGEFKETCGLG
jgi:hypothetical protein